MPDNLDKLSVAELDALKTQAAQAANEQLERVRQINVVMQSKIAEERAAEEAARILANVSPEARKLMVNALIKGETATNDASGKAGGV